jgi:hypothetical protein
LKILLLISISRAYFVYALNICVLDEIQNLLYNQARLQCNSGDDRGKNEDILKTGRGLTIKLSKNVFCFMYFYLISLGISVKIGARTAYEVIKFMTCLYFHVNIRTAKYSSNCFSSNAHIQQAHSGAVNRIKS